jgi:uroporphyrinogen III methyltransferase/synthase
MSGLAGKRVLVTRAPHQRAALDDALTDRHAIPVEFPVIEIQPLVPSPDVDRALTNLAHYAWVGFTSANGVRIALARWEERQGGPWPAAVRVAAVGSATAAALRSMDVPVHVVPDDFQGAALPGAMGDVRGQRVLLLRAEIADRGLADVLRGQGAEVDDLAVYRTVAAASDERHIIAARDGADAVAFTSPSTVRNFVDIAQKVGVPASGLVVACIGPVTAGAAREAGLPVHIEAVPHTIAGLVDGLESYWSEERSPRARPTRPPSGSRAAAR